MFKIRILTIGKTKEEWLKAALEEYTKRLSKSVEIVWILAKNDHELEKISLDERALITLDPNGEAFSSEQFSAFLMDQLSTHGCKLSILIGGAEGIPKSLKQKSKQISLSKMTFTHQITRLVLLEQIYRALEITKGSSYHK